MSIKNTTIYVLFLSIVGVVLSLTKTATDTNPHNNPIDRTSGKAILIEGERHMELMEGGPWISMHSKEDGGEFSFVCIDGTRLRIPTHCCFIESVEFSKFKVNLPVFPKDVYPVMWASDGVREVIYRGLNGEVLWTKDSMVP